MAKRCFKCGITKELSEFYAHPRMADGHLNKCKACAKRDVALRAQDPEKRPIIAAYERARFHDPKRREKVRQYIANAKVHDPRKAAARNAVRNAVRAGLLTKRPCEVCGDVNSQGHHEDYDKPLDVRWLCFTHHREIHGQRVNVPGYVLPQQRAA